MEELENTYKLIPQDLSSWSPSIFQLKNKLLFNVEVESLNITISSINLLNIRLAYLKFI